jgi:hypothetical protein
LWSTAQIGRYPFAVCFLKRPLVSQKSNPQSCSDLEIQIFNLFLIRN